MHRIVHLDLKGAPWKVPYIEKVLLSAKQWGATGVLLEWEDTFPYRGELVAIGSVGGSGGDGVYSLEEVQLIFRFCRENGLEAIQLIQTIGHMEFVLKHPVFSGLREEPRSPSALCPSRQESLVLVCAMLDQALSLQPDANYIHIGADEVWHQAVCTDCQRRAALSPHGRDSLYLEHIRNMALFLKQKKHNLTILMWDDMLRPINFDTLRAHQLGELVEPVLWDYNIREYFRISSSLWSMYRQLFPKVWAASAFKGASGSCRVLAPVSRYVSNHEAWLQEFKQYESSINFAGIFLTGWSRYDHYATLCELLPVMLPSLASCLRVLTKTDDQPTESVISEYLPPNHWPGHKLAMCIHQYTHLRERCHALIDGDLITTWLNPWQIENNYTSPQKVDEIAKSVEQLCLELRTLQMELSHHLHATTGTRSAEEWIATFITPSMKKLTELKNTAEAKCKADASIRPDKVA